MKAPKDLNKYLDSHLAGLRLLYCALSNVMSLKPGWRVKWHLTVSLWNDNPPPELKIIPRQSSFSSGDAE